MSILTLTLPRLKAGQEPITFANNAKTSPTSPSSPTIMSSWVESTTVASLGRAFCQRIELMVALRGEDERARQCNADPSAANEWTFGDEEAESSGGEENGVAGEADSRQHTAPRKKKFTKINDDELLIDWYDVLKLENGDGATEDQIKNAYRKRCLETHPDKQTDHSDELFKKVQRAFEILGDPDTRQAFDSSRPFDDTIPGEAVEEAAFYTTFGPVFERNRKWSVERTLPSLGNDKTPYKDVVRFYDRWMAYQSWRDFSHLADLEEIDESMCREEKRFYMRENERELAQYNKQELKRIRTLVERARKNDPRLRRKREMDEERRKKDQEEREAFRRKIREDEEKRRADAEARERQQKEDSVRAAQEAKAVMRQAQQTLVEFFTSHGLLDNVATNKFLVTAVRRPNITWLFSKMSSPEEANEALSTVQAGSTDRRPLSPSTPHADGGTEEVEAVVLFNALVEKTEQRVGCNRYGEAIKKLVDATAVDKKTAAAAAPSKNSASAPESAARTAEPEWTEDDLHRLQKATAKYPPGTIERWSKIAVAVRNHFTEEQCMVKVNELTAALQAGTIPAVGVTSAAAAAAAAASMGGDSAASPVAPVSDVDEWTVKQQKQLEQGLRELKDYREKDKFQKIAKIVEGKTAKECFERFKYLRDMMKKK